MKKIILVSIIFLFYFSTFGQEYCIGEYLSPSKESFKLIGISPIINVHSYQFIGSLSNKYLYGRKIEDIVVGVRNYNDVQVPSGIIENVQKMIPFPFAYRNGIYGVNIDN